MPTCTLFLLRHKNNKYLQLKENQKRGSNCEGNTEKLGQGTVDSPRTRIRRENHHHKRKPSHLSALPQRQERNNLLLQRRSRHNPKRQNNNPKRRRRRNPTTKNSPQNHRKKELNPVRSINTPTSRRSEALTMRV